MKKLLILGLILASVGCTKNTTGSCLDKIMSQVSEELRDNSMANIWVIKWCKENGNDPKKVSDFLTSPKQ